MTVTKHNISKAMQLIEELLPQSVNNGKLIVSADSIITKDDLKDLAEKENLKNLISKGRENNVSSIQVVNSSNNSQKKSLK